MLLTFLDSHGSTAIVTLTLLVSELISTYVLLQHLLHYNNQRLQSYVVRILVFLPIYGAITYLLYLFPGVCDILEMLRDIWEGLLIHSFLCLMMEYCGGESNCGLVISRDPAVIRHPWPISSIKRLSLNEDIPLNAGFVKSCRMGTMQYAFMRPLLAILSVLFRISGTEKWVIVGIFKSLAINASVYLALYALGLFYLATERHPGLAKARSLHKFMALKVLVVFTFYQRCIIFWFTTLDSHYAEGLSTFLVLLELPFFALLQLKAYNIEEFLDRNSVADGRQGLRGDMENLGSAESASIFSEPFLGICSKLGLNADDIRCYGTKDGMNTILANGSQALNMTDLFSDIYYNYSDKYRKHSLLTQDSADIVEVEPPAERNEEERGVPAYENFAEFDRLQHIQKLEEKANTLSKMQFL